MNNTLEVLHLNRGSEIEHRIERLTLELLRKYLSAERQYVTRIVKRNL